MSPISPPLRPPRDRWTSHYLRYTCADRRLNRLARPNCLARPTSTAAGIGPSRGRITQSWDFRAGSLVTALGYRPAPVAIPVPEGRACARSAIYQSSWLTSARWRRSRRTESTLSSMLSVASNFQISTRSNPHARNSTTPAQLPRPHTPTCLTTDRTPA